MTVESSEEKVAKQALATMPPEKDVPGFSRPYHDTITGVKGATSTLEATQRNFAEKGIVKPAFGEALDLAAKVKGNTPDAAVTDTNIARPK